MSTLSTPNGQVPTTGHVWMRQFEQFVNGLAAWIAAAAGLFFADVVAVSALATNVYSNGTAGVGATLTASSNGVFATLDGFVPIQGMLVLVTAEASGSHNGLYALTTLGTTGTKWVLTRVGWWSASAQLKTGALMFVKHGTTYGNTSWRYTAASSPTMGTTALTFSQAAAGLVGGAAAVLGVAQDVASLAGATTVLTVVPPASGLYRVSMVASAHTNTDGAVTMTVAFTDAVESFATTLSPISAADLVHDSNTGTASASVLIRASTGSSIVVASTGSTQTTTRFSAVVERLN